MDKRQPRRILGEDLSKFSVKRPSTFNQEGGLDGILYMWPMWTHRIVGIF